MSRTHDPAVSAARMALAAALDAAKLSKSRRTAIDSAIHRYAIALEDAYTEAVTPESVKASLASTGRVIWLDGYHHALRDASHELSGVFNETVEALAEHTSALRLDVILADGGRAPLPMWKGIEAARSETYRAHRGRPLHAIVAAARAATARALPETADAPTPLAGPPENYADAALADAHADEPPDEG